MWEKYQPYLAHVLGFGHFLAYDRFLVPTLSSLLSPNNFDRRFTTDSTRT